MMDFPETEGCAGCVRRMKITSVLYKKEGLDKNKAERFFML